jgi:CopG family nickel-responsive transcriptional regulator
MQTEFSADRRGRSWGNTIANCQLLAGPQAWFCRERAPFRQPHGGDEDVFGCYLALWGRKFFPFSKKGSLFLDTAAFACYFFKDRATREVDMARIVRFGISMEENLLAEFDRLIRKKGYQNRSEAIRDLVRDALVRDHWESQESEVVGTITLVYDHRKRELSERLLEMQHNHHHTVLSTLHVHLDEDNCLEVLAVRGQAKELQRLADQLISQKGVLHGKLTITAVGKIGRENH